MADWKGSREEIGCHLAAARGPSGLRVAQNRTLTFTINKIIIVHICVYIYVYNFIYLLLFFGGEGWVLGVLQACRVDGWGLEALLG